MTDDPQHLDAFLERGGEQLASLKADEALLLEKEDELRHRRQEVHRAIEELEGSLEVYTRVMGLRTERKRTPAPSDEIEGGSIADVANALMLERGGSMRVADLVQELAIRRGEGSVPAYATIYTSLNRDKRFAKAGPGEFRIQPTDEEVLEEVARRQLRLRPPGKFVGLNFLANELGWHSKLDDLMRRDVLLKYPVVNPNNPEFPTTAIRVATDSEEARLRLPADLLADVEALDYSAT